MKKTAYAKAGVDINNKMSALAAVKKMIRTTATPGVLNDVGAFGGFFSSPGRDRILVASSDGVGTKLMVAVKAGRHDTVGQDLVNHCVNDILVHGAAPLFFMDYVGTSKFKPEVFRQVIAGLCKACRENGCALLGGETAELPGLYPANDYDLVGTIVGSVPKNRVITGNEVKPGDIIIGLPSTGLHTNGYSLARKLIFEKAGLGINDMVPGTGKTAGAALLAVHRSYLKPVMKLMDNVRIHGLAHITGGAFPDNIARIMPERSSATIDTSAWRIPPLFRFLRETGNVDWDEMYHVFNMGIGMVVFVAANNAGKAFDSLSKSGAMPRIIGRVERDRTPVKLVLPKS